MISYKDYELNKSAIMVKTNGIEQKRLIFKRKMKLLQGSDGLMVLLSILDLRSCS